jgi:ATP-binding cassette, subfamily B, multidrug efflux pump
MHHGGLHEDDIAGKAYDRLLMGRFVGYLRPHLRSICYVLLLLPPIAGAKLVQPYIVKLAIDNHIVTGNLNGLPGLALLFLALIFGESLLIYAEVYLLQRVGQQVMFTIREQLFTHLQKLSLSFFDRTPAGGLVTRLTSDVEVLGEMFAAGIITIVGDLLLLAGIIGIMLWMNPTLSLVTFSVLPLLFFVVFRFRRLMRDAFRQVRSRLARLNSFLAESIGGMAIIQLFNRQEGEQRRFSQLNAEYRDANRPVITWDASLYALVETLSSVAVGLIIWYGGGEIVRDRLSFGALVAFIQYSEKFFGPIRDLSSKYSVMQGAMAALERIFTLLDSTEYLPDAPPFASSQDPPSPSEGEGQKETAAMEFRNVWFAYRDDDYILKGVSLTLRRGEKLAIVGETGGGKTTITRLLSRLYDIRQGSITLNGVDIRELPLKHLRSRIGVVLQEPFLFTGTIASNITLGDERAAARMEEAARTVGADRFISRLPKGFDEEVRERGNNFSAGERQLISFARAVAFDPEILVLDEATSSVDSASERLIQEGLAALLAGRTSIVVAHRLSTIRDADRIVVIHHGEKREEGSHEELMAAQGLYYRLHQLQFKG